MKHATQVFTKRFGEFGSLDVVIVESPMSLFLIEKAQYVKHFLPFLSYSALSTFQDTKESFEDADKNILPHGVCHKFMILLMEQEGLESVSSTSPLYGHTDLPDWFDEVAAISCESDTFKAKRLSEFYQEGSIDSLYSLDTFLSMKHPSLEVMEKELSNLLKKAEDSANTSGYAMEVMVIEEDESRSSLKSYYVQTLLFDKFISTTFGDQGMKHILKKLSQKDSIKAWLMKELELQDIDQLNKAFEEFVVAEYQRNKKTG